MRVVEWMGSSYRDLMDTDEDVKDSVGYALERAQAGEMAGYAEPMTGKFRDIVEIRPRTKPEIARIGRRPGHFQEEI